MMAVEGPILASVIARLAEPKYNLAAYGVGLSLAMIVESPIIMMLSATISLVQGGASFRTVRNFTYILNVGVTALMLFVLIPPVFDSLVFGLMRLPPEVANLVHGSMICFIPWPAAIGFRRFWQGLLIRNVLTRRVAYGTVVRLISMAGTALILAKLTDTSGAIIGASALTIGVVMEAIATRFMAAEVIRRYTSGSLKTVEEEPLGYRATAKYYYPLALTSIIGMAISPILTFFIGQSPMAIESLAVLPVVDSLVFLFRSFGFSFQEVGIALLGKGLKYYKEIRNFCLILAGITTSALALVAFTPLRIWALTKLYGLDPVLADFGIVPMQIWVILPALSVILSLQKAVIINGGKNTSITIATIIELVFTFGLLTAIVMGFHPVGIIAATLAVVLARLIAFGYLWFPFSKSLKQPIV